MHQLPFATRSTPTSRAIPSPSTPEAHHEKPRIGSRRDDPGTLSGERTFHRPGDRGYRYRYFLGNDPDRIAGRDDGDRGPRGRSDQRRLRVRLDSIRESQYRTLYVHRLVEDPLDVIQDLR